MHDLPQKQIVKGRLFILIAAVLWGTSGAAQSYAPAAASPAVLGAFRILIAGIFISFAAYVRKDIKNFKEFLTPVFLLTGLCQAMFQFGYFSSVKLTGVAVGVTTAIGSVPFFTGVLGFLFDKEKLNIVWFISTALAVSGLCFLMFGGAQTVNIEISGILYALAAGFSYALFTLVSKKIMRTRTEDSVIGVSFLIGTVYLSVFFFIYPLDWVFEAGGISSVLYLGIISAGIAYMFYGRGLKFVKVSAVGTLTLAEPLTAALLGIFLLNESVNFYSGTGLVLLFISQIAVVFNKQ